MLLALSFVVLLLCSTLAIGEEVRITNADELIEFSNNVNNGMNYSGTTVLLGSDIEFTDELSKQVVSSWCLLGQVFPEKHQIWAF